MQRFGGWWRRRRGLGLDLELFEGLEGALVGAAGGIDAVLELGESARVQAGGILYFGSF